MDIQNLAKNVRMTYSKSLMTLTLKIIVSTRSVNDDRKQTLRKDAPSCWNLVW